MSNDEYTVEFKDRVKQATEEYLKSQKLKYSWNEEKESFELVMALQWCGVIPVMVRVDTEDSDPTMCKLSTVCSGLDVPAEMRGEVAQFLLGVNYNNIIQGFTMDLTDGQVTFESLLFCYHGIVPPRSLIERYFNVSVFEIGAVMPLLALLMQGGLTATDALKAFTGGRHE